MTRDPQRRDSSSESVSTPSMSKRMAVTGGAAEAAKAEEGTAAVPVEVGRVGVGRCREKRFCRGACADAEPLLPAAVPPPRPVVLLFLRPIHLTVSPNIHAPVMSSFFDELKKSGGVKRNQKICAQIPSLFFSLVASSSSPSSFPSLPFAFSHDGCHGASNCSDPLQPGPSEPLAPAARPPQASFSQALLFKLEKTPI